MNTVISFLTETTSMGALWCAAAVIILLMELGAPGSFFFVSFAAGAAAAAPLAWLGFSLITQCLTCMAVSVATLALCWRLVRKQVQKRTYVSNVDALLGQQAMVTAAIAPDHIGRVRVRNEEWPALCSDHAKTLHIGTPVRVVSIRGNTLFVHPSTSEGKP